MRIRTIKPEFYKSETMATVGRDVRDLAKALISSSDDEGYFRSAPQLIAGECYPFDDDGAEFVRSALPQLVAIGYVHLFEGGIGQLPNFREHQRINRPSKSKLKDKCGARLTAFTEILSEPSLTEGEGEGEGEQGSGSGKGNRERERERPRKREQIQQELPGTPPAPVPPPRALSAQQAAHKLFQDHRRVQLVQIMGMEFVPDDDLGPVVINTALTPILAFCDSMPAHPELSNFERMISLYFENTWAAGCTNEKTGQPQPFPFRAFVSKKIQIGDADRPGLQPRLKEETVGG